MSHTNKFRFNSQHPCLVTIFILCTSGSKATSQQRWINTRLSLSFSAPWGEHYETQPNQDLLVSTYKFAHIYSYLVCSYLQVLLVYKQVCDAMALHPQFRIPEVCSAVASVWPLHMAYSSILSPALGTDPALTALPHTVHTLPEHPQLHSHSQRNIESPYSAPFLGTLLPT